MLGDPAATASVPGATAVSMVQSATPAHVRRYSALAGPPSCVSAVSHNRANAIRGHGDIGNPGKPHHQDRSHLDGKPARPGVILAMRIGHRAASTAGCEPAEPF